MKAALLQNVDINRVEWDKFVSNSPQGSVFLETGYMDALLSDSWAGIVLQDDDGIQAIMPLNIKSKFEIQYALQPLFVKYWGIAFAAKDFKNFQKEYSWKKKIVAAIIEAIPNSIKSFNFNFHPQFDYPLPFYWQKYKIQTNYTSYLNIGGMAEEDIFKNYTDSLKNSIRTAKKSNIGIVKEVSAEALVHILSENEKAGKEVVDPKHYSKVHHLFDWALKTGKGFSLTAVDENNVPLASSLYLQDQRFTYALTHNILHSKKHTDALSLLVHHAITMSASVNLNFDFLGSMIEPVEAFNRRFNARPIPYLNISRKNRLVTILGK